MKDINAAMRDLKELYERACKMDFVKKSVSVCLVPCMEKIR